MPRYDSEVDGMMVLLDAMGGVSPGAAIEQQEKAGQSAMVNSADLPINMHLPRDRIEAATGIKFGEPVNDMFVAADLPPGWRKAPTEHPMWSDLLDDQGRKRAAIFYKAAFYDRSAHMSWEHRYAATREYADGPKGYEDGSSRAVVRDNATGSVLFASEWRKNGSDSREDREADQKAAQGWLAAEFPEHDDPFAYWN
jgi:hypothetical protein